MGDSRFASLANRSGPADAVSIPDVCGASWWAMLHGWARAIETDGCSPCGGFAVKAARALHDLVNAKLGRPLFDQKNFREIAQLYHEYAHRQTGIPPGS